MNEKVKEFLLKLVGDKRIESDDVWYAIEYINALSKEGLTTPEEEELLGNLYIYLDECL